MYIVFNMDKYALESFLFSDFTEDNYLFESSSSSESDEECCCSKDSDTSVEKLQSKRPKVGGFAEVSVPNFSDSEFKNNFRVNKKTCKKITELIFDDFYSEHKGGWERITPVKATYILLWYLGSQETFKQISERFKITQSCIHNIVKVGTRNLSSQLPDYIKWPELDDYSEISDGFYGACKIDGIIGAIGLSHIRILKPKEESEKYINKKNYYSIAIQGIVDNNRKFIDLFISEGAIDPIDILDNSPTSTQADEGLFGDYFLLGDRTYPSLPWLIVPFTDDSSLIPNQVRFNWFHGSGHCSIKETFGYLKGRFRRLDHLENKDLPFIIQCVRAACVIHNICVDCGDACEFFIEDEGIFDGEDNTLTDDNEEENRLRVFNLFLEELQKL